MSGIGLIGNYTNRASEVAGARQLEETAAQWGNVNGTVAAVNADGSVEVDVDYVMTGPEGKLKPPRLSSVPINHMRGSQAAFIIPPKVGDKVRLSPLMRSSENLHTGDDEWTASDARMNALSDMEATLAGGNALTDTIPNYDPENAHMRFNSEGTYGIKGSPDGKIKIEGSQGNIYELVAEAIGLCRDGFELLGTESTLDHVASYAQIGASLEQIVAKLEAMALE